MIIAGLVSMAIGLLFFLGTVVGVHRFPDFYTRMHAAAKGDTLSSALFVFGVLLISLENFDIDGLAHSIKLAFIIIFIFIASPTASHALLNAGLSLGLRPWSQTNQEVQLEPEESTGESS